MDVMTSNDASLSHSPLETNDAHKVHNHPHFGPSTTLDSDKLVTSPPNLMHDSATSPAQPLKVDNPSSIPDASTPSSDTVKLQSPSPSPPAHIPTESSSPNDSESEDDVFRVRGGAPHYIYLDYNHHVKIVAAPLAKIEGMHWTHNLDYFKRGVPCTHKQNVPCCINFNS